VADAEVELKVLNETKQMLPVTVEPFYSVRNVADGDCVRCVVTGPADGYLEIHVSIERPPRGVWLHPSIGASGRFEPTASDDLIGVLSGATRNRLRGWPLGPRAERSSSVGLYVSAEEGMTVDLAGGERVVVSSRDRPQEMLWVDGLLTPERALSFAVNDRGRLALSGLDSLRYKHA
jgi:hypothetical protein